jgi:hypothetical protein
MGSKEVAVKDHLDAAAPWHRSPWAWRGSVGRFVPQSWLVYRERLLPLYCPVP